MMRLIPWFFWALGLFVAFHPALLSGFARLQITPGDPRLVHYILEHTWLWFTDHPLHPGLWDPPIFYPATGAGAYSDTLLGSAPFYFAWRALGIAESASFQLWMMTCLSLCYASSHWFLRRCLGFGAWPAALGAFFHGFAIVRLSNFNSPQFFTVFWAMLALGALARALAPGATPRGQASWILAFAACTSLQMWSAFYTGFFLGLILAVAAVAALSFRESRRPLIHLLRSRPLVIGAAILLGAASVAPLALAHLEAAANVGWRPTGEVATSMPRLQSWFYPGSRNWLYGALGQTELFNFPPYTDSHNSNGPGFVTALAFLFGLVRAGRSAARMALVTMLVLMLLTTRFPGGFSLWPLIYETVPGAKAARYPTCIGIYVPIAVSIGMASFASLRLERLALLPGVIALFCCLEQFHVLSGDDEAAYRALVERIAADVPDDCETFLVISKSARVERELGRRAPRRTPLPPPNRRTQVAAMWAGLAAGKPTLNGFYGNSPPGYGLAISVRDIDRLALVERNLADWLAANEIEPDRVARIEIKPAASPWRQAEDE